MFVEGAIYQADEENEQVAGGTDSAEPAAGPASTGKAGQGNGAVLMERCCSQQRKADGIASLQEPTFCCIMPPLSRAPRAVLKHVQGWRQSRQCCTSAAC